MAASIRVNQSGTCLSVHMKWSNLEDYWQISHMTHWEQIVQPQQNKGRQKHMYRQISNISHTKSQTLMFLVSSCSCLCPIYWSQVLSREWRCSWSSADRRCSNFIWVINTLLPSWVLLILEVSWYMAFKTDSITITKQGKTKSCAYYMGYAVYKYVLGKAIGCWKDLICQHNSNFDSKWN